MVVNVEDENFGFAIHEATTTSLYHEDNNNNKSLVDGAHRDDDFSFFDHNHHNMRWSMNGARDGFGSFSHADELFENGKIRPLCPFAVAGTREHEAPHGGFRGSHSFMSVSMFEEPPLVEPILVYHNEHSLLSSDQSMIFNYSHYYSDKMNHFHHLNCPRTGSSSSSSGSSSPSSSSSSSPSSRPLVNIQHSVTPKPSIEAVIHQPSLTLLTLVQDAPCPTHKGGISTHMPSGSPPLKVKDLLVQETILPSLASPSKSNCYKNGLHKKNKCKSTNKVAPFYLTSPPRGHLNNNNFFRQRVDTQGSSCLLYDINSHHSPPGRGAPQPTHSFRHQILACLVCWHEV